MIRWPWLLLAAVVGFGAGVWYSELCWLRLIRFFAKGKD